uniref:Uncharacterized protein n=1 Tax=Anopheles albimanus TaxID=7167 RepID=A0A182FXL2_ANOAL
MCVNTVKMPGFPLREKVKVMLV